MLVCIPSNSFGNRLAFTNGKEKDSLLYRSLSMHKSEMNEIGMNFPTEEKKIRQKRSQELYAPLTNSWSDKIIEELLHLLGQLLESNRIYAPKNNDQFDNWGG